MVQLSIRLNLECGLDTRCRTHSLRNVVFFEKKKGTAINP